MHPIDAAWVILKNEKVIARQAERDERRKSRQAERDEDRKKKWESQRETNEGFSNQRPTNSKIPNKGYHAVQGTDDIGNFAHYMDGKQVADTSPHKFVSTHGSKGFMGFGQKPQQDYSNQRAHDYLMAQQQQQQQQQQQG